MLRLVGELQLAPGAPPAGVCGLLDCAEPGEDYWIINRSILDDVHADLQELKARKRTRVEANLLFTTACLASALSIPIAIVIVLLRNGVSPSMVT